MEIQLIIQECIPLLNLQDNMNQYPEKLTDILHNILQGAHNTETITKTTIWVSKEANFYQSH